MEGPCRTSCCIVYMHAIDLFLSIFEKSFILSLSIVLFKHLMNHHSLTFLSDTRTRRPAGLEFPENVHVPALVQWINEYRDSLVPEGEPMVLDDEWHSVASLNSLVMEYKTLCVLPTEFILDKRQFEHLLAYFGLLKQVNPSSSPLFLNSHIHIMNYRNRSTLTALPHFSRVSYHMVTAQTSYEDLEHFQKTAEMLNLDSYPPKWSRLSYTHSEEEEEEDQNRSLYSSKKRSKDDGDDDDDDNDCKRRPRR